MAFSKSVVLTPYSASWNPFMFTRQQSCVMVPLPTRLTSSVAWSKDVLLPLHCLESIFATLLKHAFGESTKGIYLRTTSDGNLFELFTLRAKTRRHEKFTRDLLFADDVAITTHTQEDLQWLLDHFSDACRHFTLSISLAKMQVMRQDGQILRHLLYGELATGKRPTGAPQLCFKDICKSDLQVLSINTDLGSRCYRQRCLGTVKLGMSQYVETQWVKVEEKRLHKKTACLASRPIMAFIHSKCGRDTPKLVFTASTDTVQWVQIYGLTRLTGANDWNKIFQKICLILYLLCELQLYGTGNSSE